jgi:Tol biopolymer transport system component
MSRAPRCTVLALVLAFAGASAARADVYEAIRLASLNPLAGNQLEQADRAEHPAISGDGRYVAFDGSFGGVAGVWRKDVLTGALAPVAVGAENTPQGEAKLPSISEHGDYVSFTTTARLDEKNDTNKGPDVYVRDMNNPDLKPCPSERNEASEPCAYKLASAVDGSATGLTYKYGSASEEVSYGSLASGRSALSADGRYVAFVTTAASDLAGAETPPLQVAVRDLQANRTRLVSALYDPSTGKPATDPETGRELPVPTTREGKTGAVFDGGSIPPFKTPDAAVGASISADGSTVAWLGEQIAAQVPVLAEDVARKEVLYAEPLWRRIEGSSWPPTKRVTGGSDPVNPACEVAQAGGEVALRLPPTLEDPCQGPFNISGNIESIQAANGSDYLPRLSADGYTVAFLASAPLVEGGEFGSTGNFSDDLYVVNMRDPSFTRVEALRRLTAIAAGSGRDFGRVEAIEDLGVSPDGTEISFASRRTVFPLGSPTYVSPPLAAPAEESGPQEIYNVDLSNDTLTRVTRGFNGGPTESTHVVESSFVGSPSFSADGTRLAFSSLAPNLVYGDGNEASDVFVVDRERFSSAAVQQYISAPPANPTIQPGWLLGVSARSRRDGSVVLYVFVPGSGQLRASAQSAVLEAAAQPARGSRHRGRTSHRHARTVVAMRTVAAAARNSGGEGLLQVPLVLAPRYRALALRQGGQSASVSLLFSSPGHAPVKGSIAVTFLDPLGSHQRAKKHTHSGGQHR